MGGSQYGHLFRLSTWGESHGKAVGVTVDGVPAGLPLAESDIQSYLDRRRPGQNSFTTARAEKDEAEILSGLFEGKTTGTPVSMIVFNHDQRSADYGPLSGVYRPGHADQVFDLKYGFRDYRGGGRSSARETIGRVAAGAIACKILSRLHISFTTYVASIGPVTCSVDRTDESRIMASPLYMPDAEAEKEAAVLLGTCRKEQTSVGSSVVCLVRGLMPGIGEPVFDKLDACLGKALFSIGAVKAVEIGDGAEVSRAFGHENNDCYRPGPVPEKASNHAGGIYGGISDGSELSLHVHFKPTPSIARPQQALAADGNVREISIGGRHDPVIAPRAAVVVESMTAVTILDLLMQNMAATMDGILRFYGA